MTWSIPPRISTSYNDLILLILPLNRENNKTDAAEPLHEVWVHTVRKILNIYESTCNLQILKL